ncbi:MAG: 5-aminolevulic acid synthase [Pararhodobacter sp.]
MHRMFTAALAALVCAPAALTSFAPAQAQTLGVAEAQAMLFPHDQVEVARYTLPGLSEEQTQIIIGVAREQRYFAAMAFAPDQGILAEPTVLAANYHSRETAHAAALAQCNALRSGGAPCTLALEVRPAGWEARALHLSADATEAFEGRFSQGAGPRAFAISDATAAWGTGQGSAAAETALAACAEGGATDCRVVIAD